MQTIKKLFALLTSREKRNLYLLFGAVLVMAGLEVVSVAAILPFLSVAADPSSIQETEQLRWVYETFQFQSQNAFLIALGLGAFGTLIASNAFIVLTTWSLYRYVWRRNHSLSRRLLKKYLDKPYEYFLTRNTSELSKNVLEEAKEVTAHLLLPGMEGAAKSIVALSIVAFLVYIDPLLAFIISVVLGGAYGIIYLAVRNRLDTLGASRVKASEGRYQSVSEAFGGIKEVKLKGKEEAFVQQFDDPSWRYVQNQATAQVISKAPRYILEAVSFGGIILIAIYLLATQNNIEKVIPMLGLYAFAGYRLMPALQRAFHGLAKARFNIAALDTLYNDLLLENEATDYRTGETSDSSREALSPLPLDQELAMHNVSFAYPGAEEPAVADVSLTVEAKSTAAFVGQTGSGKTTTVDLIMGLLKPQTGQIVVDGQAIGGENIERWQKSIGYVPQDIYLADETIARNIAFGVPEEDINPIAVEEAARMAQIYDFIQHKLPKRFDSMVGERGVKLSGGQRQRIGIARALYHKPSVLVFDEATSALDQKTEKDVMDSIYALDGSRTVILISHRLSTVKKAHRIFLLQEGRLLAAGDYDSLMVGNQSFQSMARA